MKEESQGGYFIPQSMTIYVDKKGVFWRLVRGFGEFVFSVGAGISRLGCEERENHPYAEIMKRVEESRADK